MADLQCSECFKLRMLKMKGKKVKCLFFSSIISAFLRFAHDENFLIFFLLNEKS